MYFKYGGNRQSFDVIMTAESRPFASGQIFRSTSRMMLILKYTVTIYSDFFMACSFKFF